MSVEEQRNQLAFARVREHPYRSDPEFERLGEDTVVDGVEVPGNPFLHNPLNTEWRYPLIIQRLDELVIWLNEKFSRSAGDTRAGGFMRWFNDHTDTTDYVPRDMDRPEDFNYMKPHLGGFEIRDDLVILREHGFVLDEKQHDGRLSPVFMFLTLRYDVPPEKLTFIYISPTIQYNRVTKEITVGGSCWGELVAQHAAILNFITNDHDLNWAILRMTELMIKVREEDAQFGLPLRRSDDKEKPRKMISLLMLNRNYPSIEQIDESNAMPQTSAAWKYILGTMRTISSLS